MATATPPSAAIRKKGKAAKRNRMVLGQKIHINLNAKRGYRKSPGSNAVASAIQKCIKEIPDATKVNPLNYLLARKKCFVDQKVQTRKAKPKYGFTKGQASYYK